MPSQVKLPPEDVANLMAAQRALHDLLPEFDNAEDCGIDCREYRRVAAEAAERIEKLLNYYR